MHFEVHLTVNTTDVEKFIEDCKVIGVKPIVIEVENKELIERQVMTSSKHIAPSFEDTLLKLSEELTDLNYTIIRQKVEIQPEFQNKHRDFVYYETHFRLKLPKEFNRTVLIELCRLHKFHLSKNLFKKSDTFDYQMITFRDNSINYAGFISGIEKMKTDLNSLNIEYDKVEIEECIFDTADSLDKNWVN